MDTTSEFEKILQAIIAYVYAISDVTALNTICGLTRNFLFIIDETKTPAYKAAIVTEYLEGLEPILKNPAITSLRAYCSSQKSSAAQSKFSREALDAVKKFLDPQRIAPELVIFWLQKNCNAEQLKNMDTFMLFLTKEQQELVYKRDQTLLEDPKIQLLKDCIVKLIT